MIFVTVGTHEQGFTRLIAYVDQMVAKREITEEVIMQTGFTKYTPKHCQFSHFFDFDTMTKFESKARIVITHGGPSTFMSVINKGKRPIVVPRLKEYHEHVNNHQLVFAEEVLRKGYPIVLVKDISSLDQAILQADAPVSMASHNKRFTEKFAQVVKELVGHE